MQTMWVSILSQYSAADEVARGAAEAAFHANALLGGAGHSRSPSCISTTPSASLRRPADACRLAGPRRPSISMPGTPMLGMIVPQRAELGMIITQHAELAASVPMQACITRPGSPDSVGHHERGGSGGGGDHGILRASGALPDFKRMHSTVHWPEVCLGIATPITILSRQPWFHVLMCKGYRPPLEHQLAYPRLSGAAHAYGQWAHAQPSRSCASTSVDQRPALHS